MECKICYLKNVCEKFICIKQDRIENSMILNDDKDSIIVLKGMIIEKEL